MPKPLLIVGVLDVDAVDVRALVHLPHVVVGGVAVLGLVLAVGTLKSGPLVAGVLEVLLEAALIGEAARTPGTAVAHAGGRQVGTISVPDWSAAGGFLLVYATATASCQNVFDLHHAQSARRRLIWMGTREKERKND